jgi:hypothetical protein
VALAENELRAAASAPAAPAAAVASQGPVDCAAAPAGHRCPLSHLHPAECQPQRLAALAVGDDSHERVIRLDLLYESHMRIRANNED